jgi:hypothetical protein
MKILNENFYKYIRNMSEVKEILVKTCFTSMGVIPDMRKEDLAFIIDNKDLTIIHGHVQSLRVVVEIRR